MGCRKNFVSKTVKMLQLRGFDGLSFEWNFPVCWQSNCLLGSSDEKQGFVALVKASPRFISVELFFGKSYHPRPLRDSISRPRASQTETIPLVHAKAICIEILVLLYVKDCCLHRKVRPLELTPVHMSAMKIPPMCWPQRPSKVFFFSVHQELKTAFEPEGLLLSTLLSGYADKIGETAYDIRQLGELLDFANVMTHDYHGFWDKKTGHHSPIKAQPGDQHPDFNLVRSLDTYLDSVRRQDK
jgi:hypothetical protein